MRMQVSSSLPTTSPNLAKSLVSRKSSSPPSKRPSLSDIPLVHPNDHDDAMELLR